MVTVPRSRLVEAQRESARVHRRVVRSLAKAERALNASGERELIRIERTLQAPVPPLVGVDQSPLARWKRLERFLWASANSLGLSSGSLLLVIDRAYVGVLFGGTAREVTDLHFCLGEGPAIDSCQSGSTLEVADFGRATTRWPAFAPAVLELGIRSALCIPVSADETDLVLAFWGSQPIPPRPRSWTASRTQARSTQERFDQLKRVKSIAQALLRERPGIITFESLLGNVDATVTERAMVYQAAGVLAERLAIEPREALDLLRVQAWADQQPLEDLCARVMSDL